MSGRVKKAAAPKKKANGYKMPAPIQLGEIINDTILRKKWRIGPSIGIGGFGEIYSACEHGSSPKKGETYPYAIKIEPMENGPLFVENHFYLKHGKKTDIENFQKSNKLPNVGMPCYYGRGSHEYKGEKYRFLVLERYGQNVWNLFLKAGRKFPTTTVFLLGLQMLEVLEYIHGRGYVHADIKGANILLGMKKGTENQAYLVDFGLATRVKKDEGFKPDPKRAHNGTIEYTSRDAHLGVSTMRGDLEILAYNMLHWIVGTLPWEKSLKQPKTVQTLKESFMKNVRSEINKQFTDVPEALIKFFEYINSLKPKDAVDYTKCKQIFESYLKSHGVSRTSNLEFTNKKQKATALEAQDESDDGSESNKEKPPKKNAANENGNAKITKRGRKVKVADENSENEEPEVIEEVKPTKRGRKAKATDLNSDSEDTKETKKKVPARARKRMSSEPSVVVRVKRTKMAPKATPPSKKNIATQTSVDKLRRSPRQVSFDSPISAVLGEEPVNGDSKSANSSGDIFDDSFVIEEKKVKPKRKLLSEREVTIKKVVRKKVSAAKPTSKSWKDSPTIVNGRQPRN